MEYRRAQATLLAVLVILPLIEVIPSVRAESYTLTISPQYSQEANSPGVELSLTVTGANTIVPYNFEWIVQDPSGNNRNAPSSSSGESSFTVSVVYPGSFGGGAAIEFVGNYTVTVIQVNPLETPPPSFSGDFDVGLTDKLVYSRTSAVSIKATSYDPGENVTIDMTRGGNPVFDFPDHVLADSNGNVAYTWQTGPSTQTGNYTVALTGSTTPAKSPLDSQAFRVQPATLGVTVSVPGATLGPGQVLTIVASATYPDSSILNQGTVLATISTSGFQIGSQLSLGFDQSQAQWVGNYTVKENDPTGIWLVEVSASDPWGNVGVGSKSAFASIPPLQQSPLTSFWFLTVLGAVAAGALGGLLFLKRKRVTRHQLQVDLQAVGREADRVKNQEFFRSVQRQLGRMRDESKEKTDG